MFGRSWLMVAHVDELPEPGDYRLVDQLRRARRPGPRRRRRGARLLQHVPAPRRRARARRVPATPAAGSPARTTAGSTTSTARSSATPTPATSRDLDRDVPRAARRSAARRGARSCSSTSTTTPRRSHEFLAPGRRRPQRAGRPGRPPAPRRPPRPRRRRELEAPGRRQHRDVPRQHRAPRHRRPRSLDQAATGIQLLRNGHSRMLIRMQDGRSIGGLMPFPPLFEGVGDLPDVGHVLVPRVPEPEHRVLRPRLRVLHHELADRARPVDVPRPLLLVARRPTTTSTRKLNRRLRRDQPLRAARGPVGAPGHAALDRRRRPRRLAPRLPGAPHLPPARDDRPRRSASSASPSTSASRRCSATTSRQLTPMHPFVALMRTYCIDYTNSHDQSLYDEIMEPDYVVHISGFDLPPRRALQPGRHRPVRAGTRPRAAWCTSSCSTATGCACASASTRAMPDRRRPALACWRGHRAVPLERHAGSPRTTSSRTTWPCTSSSPSGAPHAARAAAPRPVGRHRAGARRRRRPRTSLRAWLSAGRPRRRRHAVADRRQPHRTAARRSSTSTAVTVNDLFSAGHRVPFHVTLTRHLPGRHRRRARRARRHRGHAARRRASPTCADGAVDDVRAVTDADRRCAAQLTGALADLMTTSSIATRPDVDLLDPTFHVGDPHPAYRWMRQHEPIYRDERNGLWCITRMEHLRHVERHADDFVQQPGLPLGVGADRDVDDQQGRPRPHAEQRKLISDRFTPRAVGRLEDEVRAIVAEAPSTRSRSASRFEVVDALAARDPVDRSPAGCIGWDDEHWRDVRVVVRAPHAHRHDGARDPDPRHRRHPRRDRDRRARRPLAGRARGRARPTTSCTRVGPRRARRLPDERSPTSTPSSAW